MTGQPHPGEQVAALLANGPIRDVDNSQRLLGSIMSEASRRATIQLSDETEASSNR